MNAPESAGAASPLGVDSAPAERSYSEGYVWYVIALLTLVNAFNYMDRMALSVLMPAIKQDMALSDGQLGLLVGFAFSVFYAICGIPIARWADYGVRRNIIALALTTWSIMTALSGAAQNFWHLFWARVGVGAGEAGCLPPAQSIICDYVPLQRRAGVFAVHTFGLIAGMMLGMALAGWLSSAIGWRWTFAALGLPGIALALVVRFTLLEPRRGRHDVAGSSNNDQRYALAQLWRNPTYMLLLLFLTVNGFAQFGLNQWWPSFYARVHGLDVPTIGASLALAIGAGSGLGLLIGGVLSDRTAHRDVRWPLLAGAGATLIALPAAIGSLFASSITLSIALVAITALLWSVSSGPVVASVYSIVATNMRATAGAITIFFTSVLGFGLGPFCVGLLSDALTPSLGAESLRFALLAPICMFPAMALALWGASRTLRGDLRAAGAHV